MTALPSTEIALYEQIAQYMNLQYPGVPYHFDLSGLWTPSHQARNLYGRLNRRAWPDLFIAAPSTHDHEFLVGATRIMRPYAGLYLELKREGTQLWKKDGTLRTNPHHAEQAAVLTSLEEQGYKAMFAVGFDNAQALIDGYLYKPSLTVDSLLF